MKWLHSDNGRSGSSFPTAFFPPVFGQSQRITMAGSFGIGNLFLMNSILVGAGCGVLSGSTHSVLKVTFQEQCI